MFSVVFTELKNVQHSRPKQRQSMLVLRPRHVQLWYYAGKRGTASAVDQIIVDHHIPVEPGHILSINAQHAVDIDVQQGSHEHIDLQVEYRWRRMCMSIVVAPMTPVFYRHQQAHK